MHYTRVKIISSNEQAVLEKAINEFLAKPEVAVLKDIKFLYQETYDYDPTEEQEDRGGITTHYEDYWTVLIIYDATTS